MYRMSYDRYEQKISKQNISHPVSVRSYFSSHGHVFFFLFSLVLTALLSATNPCANSQCVVVAPNQWQFTAAHISHIST